MKGNIEMIKNFAIATVLFGLSFNADANVSIDASRANADGMEFDITNHGSKSQVHVVVQAKNKDGEISDVTDSFVIRGEGYFANSGQKLPIGLKNLDTPSTDIAEYIITVNVGNSEQSFVVPMSERDIDSKVFTIQKSKGFEKILAKD